VQETRDRIVTATTELFRRQGFHGTSLKQVADRSQSPTGSIYHFFPGGKEELGVAVMHESGAAYQSLFEWIADESDGIAEGVWAFFTGAAQALEEADFVDICPIGTVAREVASTSEPLRVATETVFAAWRASLAQRLRSEGAGPEQAEALADTLVAAIEGGFILARARRSGDCLRSTAEHMRTLVRAALPSR
jgi:AcrR family transcriptional regulator